MKMILIFLLERYWYISLIHMLRSASPLPCFTKFKVQINFDCRFCFSADAPVTFLYVYYYTSFYFFVFIYEIINLTEFWLVGCSFYQMYPCNFSLFLITWRPVSLLLFFTISEVWKNLYYIFYFFTISFSFDYLFRGVPRGCGPSGFLIRGDL